MASVSFNVEELFPFTTAEDSVVEKDWSAGSSKQTETHEFVIKRINGQPFGVYEKITYPPALWKIIDEPIVNALDHVIRSLLSKYRVTKIAVSIDKFGRIRIYNNGQGIPAVRHNIASEKLGRDIYLPTLIFGILFQGSNRRPQDSDIIGGVNGLGAKLTKCYSLDSTVETCTDATYFVQRWQKIPGTNEHTEGKPTVIDLTRSHTLPRDRTIPHTLLSFIPDYVGIFGYTAVDDTMLETLTNLVRTRVWFAAAYVGYTYAGTSTKYEITFNDEPVPVKSIADIARVYFPADTIIKTTITPVNTTKMQAHHIHPWEVCAVITDTSDITNSIISIVNGIVVSGGKHHTHIMDQIVDGIGSRMAKKFKDKDIAFNPAYVKNNIMLFLNTKIPRIGSGWDGQRKDVLKIDNIGRLGGYVLAPKFIDDINIKISSTIIDGIFESKKKKKTKNIVDYTQYVEARYAGTKNSAKAVLIPVEGKSALGQVKLGIAKYLGWDEYGALALGGVGINVRRECEIVMTSTGPKHKFSQKLATSIKTGQVGQFLQITGLDLDTKYDPKSPTFAREMKSLRYGGGIAMCVDQDLDGKGHILGQILNMFHMFWPNLLAQGYIKWFSSEIMAAYPKSGGTIISFYNLQEYTDWSKTVDNSKYNIRYFKGLATHDRDSCMHMFKNFKQRLFTYAVDDRMNKLFEVYFGDNPDLRKQVLSVPTRILSAETIADQTRTRIIKISDHLETETDPFQRQNLFQKLNDIIDGQCEAGRMIIHGFMNGLSSTALTRVAQIAGYISEHECYHHGESSLHNSITVRGLVTTGGMQLPFITPYSNFGTRSEGGGDAGSPRYINCKLCPITALIFPTADYYNLDFNYDGDKPIAPKQYVPIVPLAILEYKELPAHGWKGEYHARDVFSVIKCVRRMIEIENAPVLAFPPCRYAGAPYEWTGTFQSIRGKLHSFGRYEVTGDILTITELPMRVWTAVYVADLQKRLINDAEKGSCLYSRVMDRSADFTICIEITLVPGALDKLESMGDLCYTTGIEEYFGLRKHMTDHINLMTPDGAVKTFPNYESVVKYWFPVRQKYYDLRMSRQRTILALKQRRQANIVRYITTFDASTIIDLEDAAIDTIISAAGYDKMRSGIVDDPKYIKTDQIDFECMHNAKSSYKYLLATTDRMRSRTGLAAEMQKLAACERAIADHDDIASRGRFPGASVWLDELNALEASIREGQRTFWKYAEASKYKYDD